MSSDRWGHESSIYLKNLSKKYPIYDRPSQKLLEQHCQVNWFPRDRATISSV